MILPSGLGPNGSMSGWVQASSLNVRLDMHCHVPYIWSAMSMVKVEGLRKKQGGLGFQNADEGLDQVAWGRMLFNHEAAC